MNKIVNINDREKTPQATIEAEASAWIVQFHNTRPTGEDMEAFHSWLRKSPEHRRTFEQLARTWNKLDGLSQLVFAEQDQQTTANIAPSTRLGGSLFRFRFAVAAAILFVVFSVVVFSVRNAVDYPRPEQFSAKYTTAIGEQKQVALPDGSGMRLNTRSITNVSYGEDARLIHLVEGEAHFDVFHNAEKPFVVYAGKIAVTAVGTAFSVYLKEDTVDVIVTDGEIKVAALPEKVTDSQAPDLNLIDEAETVASFVEGQRAVFKDKIELVESIELEEIEKKLSWRDGMLIFEGDRLQEVVEEVSRYTPIRIVILDSETRDLKIGGYFPAGNIAPMLDTFEQNFGIDVERIKDNLVYLSRK